MKAIVLFATVLFSFEFVTTLSAQKELAGAWLLDRDLSSAVDPWNRIELEIGVNKGKVNLSEKVTTGRRSHVNSWKLDTRKRPTVNQQDWWTGNRHIGAFYGDGGKVRTEAEWLVEEECMVLESRYRLETSQGGGEVREYIEYRVSEDGSRLTRITLRSTRDQPVVHVFNKR